MYRYFAALLLAVSIRATAVEIDNAIVTELESILTLYETGLEKIEAGLLQVEAGLKRSEEAQMILEKRTNALQEYWKSYARESDVIIKRLNRRLSWTLAGLVAAIGGVIVLTITTIIG